VGLINSLPNKKAAIVAADALLGINSADGSTAQFPLSALGRVAWADIPVGALDVWQAGKAATVSSPAIIAGIGDSFMHGAYAGDWHLTGWFGQLKTKLVAAGYGTHADFWPVSSNIARNSSMTGLIPFVLSPTGLSWAQNGFGELPIYTGTAAGVLAFTTPYACTQMDLVYLDSNQGTGGTWAYAVDGGAPQTITVAGDNTIKKVRLTGLANTVHTISCGSQSFNFVMQVCGVSTYPDPAKGIGYGRLAYAGATTVAGLGQSAFKPADRARVYGGSGAGGGINFAHFPVAPHLALIGLGINDNTNGQGLEGYRQTLRRLCQALRRGRANCSIVFVVNPVANGVTSDQTSNYFGNPTQWPLFQQAQWQVAREFNAGVIDFQAKWSETPVASGFTTVSQGHPTQLGHDDMADIIYRYAVGA
jgi:hypothetical protein